MPPATIHDAWFRDLYLLRAGEIGRYLRRHGTDHDDADDLVSAVFLDAWRRRDELPDREPACQRAWLYETAINHQRNHWRSQERRNRFVARWPLPEDEPDIAETLAEEAEHADRHQKITDAMTGLSSTDQAVITASLDEASVVTLGQRLGVGEASARQRLCRARQRLVIAVTLAGTATTACWALLDQLDPWVVALTA